MGRHASYKGVLDTPLPWRELTRDGKSIALIAKLSALRDHLGVTLPSAGGMVDVALALAHRHEPGFRKTPRLGPLFVKYDVDPSGADPIFQLVMKMATTHVPGFMPERPAKPTCSRFEDVELASLCLAEFAVRSALPKAAQRARARILRDHARLTTIVGPEAAQHVIQILESTGNEKAGTAGHEKTLGDRKLRQLISIFEDPRAALAKNDPIARQLVTGVWPLIVRAAQPGQIEAEESENS